MLKVYVNVNVQYCVTELFLQWRSVDQNLSLVNFRDTIPQKKKKKKKNYLHKIVLEFWSVQSTGIEKKARLIRSVLLWSLARASGIGQRAKIKREANDFENRRSYKYPPYRAFPCESAGLLAGNSRLNDRKYSVSTAATLAKSYLRDQSNVVRRKAAASCLGILPIFHISAACACHASRHRWFSEFCT